jgi:hypothetical protein
LTEDRGRQKTVASLLRQRLCSQHRTISIAGVNHGPNERASICRTVSTHVG